MDRGGVIWGPKLEDLRIDLFQSSESEITGTAMIARPIELQDVPQLDEDNQAQRWLVRLRVRRYQRR